MTERANGRITGTFLGIEDHGILSSMVTIDDGRGSQGFGGYSFDGGGPAGGKFATAYIRGLLEVVGVNTWEQLKGQLVRVEREQGLIVRIGHIMDDRWFDPKAVAAQCMVKP